MRIIEKIIDRIFAFLESLVAKYPPEQEPPKPYIPPGLQVSDKDHETLVRAHKKYDCRPFLLQVECDERGFCRTVFKHKVVIVHVTNWPKTVVSNGDEKN